MTESTPPSTADYAYQEHALQGVSRTFALTIPQLPEPLCQVVSNAYLLCRIVDTIEDDKDMTIEQKQEFANRFVAVINSEEAAETFANELTPLLSQSATAHEKDLVLNTPAVIRITHSFNSRQQAALERCVNIMCTGMVKYQASNVRDGLKDQEDMDNYCYHVAGVVGEMLAELFCDHSAGMNQHYDEVMTLSVSFGQGLQMTNILKDIWDDQARGMCWLPQETFTKYGSNLHGISMDKIDSSFEEAMGHLIGIAYSHLANALRYTLLIPKHEVGIRRFCLWALGMAVLTLRKINQQRNYTSGQQVKISRNSVKATILLTNLFTKNDTMLKLLFNLTARSLPKRALSDKFSPAVSST